MKIWLDALAPQPTDDEIIKKARERLRYSYEQFRNKAEFLANEIHRSLPDYTVHNIAHSDTLWDTASLIAGPNCILTPTEAFVLGGAFLIHDIGMGLAAYPEGIDALRKRSNWRDTIATLIREMEGRIPTSDELIHPKEIFERKAMEVVLRELHAERAEQLVLLPWKDQGQTREYYLIEDIDLQQTYGELIGKIAYSHWWDISTIEKLLDFPVNAPYWCPRDWTINPLFLACLLRVADISNIDAGRAPGFLRALRKPTLSAKEHWIFQEYLQQPDLEGDRLRYTSGRPFSLKDAQAWWLCFDTLQTVDHELRIVDALLADYRGRRFVARGVAGIEEPRRLAKYIRTENWLPVDAHLQVSDITRLIQHLGGEELYGKDYTVPLRELIQNAADAIRARRMEEEHLPNWGEVHVCLGKDEIGEWIEVEDNGLGMSTEVLIGPLLDFGKSYWGSSLMRSQFPGLVSKGFQSTGRYGIGFFSVFMWGDRVNVISRRFDAALKDTQVLEFNHGLNSRPILRMATKSEYLREGGTRIRVWFKNSSTLLFKSLSFANSSTSAWSLQIEHRKFKSISIRDIKKLCAFLCPSIDVNLYVTDIRGDTQLVISSIDWITMNGEDLLRRLLDFDEYSDERAVEEFIRQYAPALIPIKNSLDETVGRACIAPSWLKAKDRSMPVAGVITVGGLRSSILAGYVGIWDGISIRATRDLAVPVAQSSELARWATDQAKLMGSLITNPELLFEIADAVNAFGGDVGNLPIASGINGWMNFSQIAEWQDVPDEILLISDAFFSLEQRKHRKLTLHPNVLVTSKAFTIPLRSVYDDAHPVFWPNIENLLTTVVIKALAKAWSSPLEDVMQISEFTTDKKKVKREIGLADGKLIFDSVDVIKNPKKKP
jgi:hypothetical protein